MPNAAPTGKRDGTPSDIRPEHKESGPTPDHQLYAVLGAPALVIKVLLQMVVGALLVAWIGGQCIDAFSSHRPPVGTELLTGMAGWLAAATGIELAYTLFTSGPDEAVDPAILGLASAMIFLTAHIDAEHPWNAMALLGLGATMALLFAIRKQYVLPRLTPPSGEGKESR